MNNGTEEVNRGTQVVNTAGKSFEEIEALVELLFEARAGKFIILRSK